MYCYVLVCTAMYLGEWQNSEAIKVLTKLLKPQFSILESRGYLFVVFVDDSYLHGRTFSTSEDNVNTVVDVVDLSLGFTIHPEKSVLVPIQEIGNFKFCGSENHTHWLQVEKKNFENEKPAIWGKANYPGPCICHRIISSYVPSTYIWQASLQGIIEM